MNTDHPAPSGLCRGNDFCYVDGEIGVRVRDGKANSTDPAQVGAEAVASFHAGELDFAALSARMARQYPALFRDDDGRPLDNLGCMRRLLGFVQAAQRRTGPCDGSER